MSDTRANSRPIKFSLQSSNQSCARGRPRCLNVVSMTWLADAVGLLGVNYGTDLKSASGILIRPSLLHRPSIDMFDIKPVNVDYFPR